MKRIMVLFFSLLMTTMIFGCGESTTTATQQNEEANTKIEDTLNDQEGTETMDQDQDIDDVEDIVMTFDIVELPAGYPDDILPIIDSGDLEFGGRDGQEIVLKVYCKEEPSKVFEYYLNIMESAADFKQDNMAGVYFLDGVIEGNNISIKITEDTYYNGYLTSLTINVK